MAHVEAHRFRLCTGCKTAGHTRPAGGDGCRCKVLAWRTRWRTPDGKPRSKVWERKRDADAHAAEVEVSKHRGAYIDPARGRVRMRDYAADWAAARDWKDRTRKDWPVVWRRLDPLVGGLPVDQVDRLTLEQTRAKLAAKYARGVTEGTMHKLHAILRHAYASGVIGRDPTVGVAAAPRRRADDPTGRVTPDEVPTRAEALAILAGAPADYRAAVALGLAGLRIGEVLGMTAEAVDLSARQVTVAQQTDGFTVSTPKGERRRTIIVPGLVAVELRRRLRDRPTGWLFPGGGAEGTLHRNRFYELGWYPALTAAGLGPVDDDGQPVDGPGRFVFHSLRHFCASTLLAEGAPPVAVAGYLGNSPEMVSRVYSHWLRDDREVPAGVLDRVLAPAEPGGDGVSRVTAASGLR